MASPVGIGRTVRAATVTVILAAFALLPGCLHDSGEPEPLLFTGPSEPVPLWGPLPRFSFTPQEPDAGQTVSFDASRSIIGPGHTIASYTWLFGDGGTATGVTASRTYANEGAYTVRLTVTDNLGAAVTRLALVVVGTLTPPTAVIVFSKAGTDRAPDGQLRWNNVDDRARPHDHRLRVEFRRWRYKHNWGTHERLHDSGLLQRDPDGHRQFGLD